MKKMNLLAIGAGAILAATGISNAAPLPPGSGIPAVVEPFVGNGGLVGALTSNLSNGVVAATITSQVYLNDGANPLAPGLTFVYTVTNTGTDTLERVNFNSFAGFSTDAGYSVANLPTADPSTVTRSTIAQDNGALVGFNFDTLVGQPTLAPGATTVLIVNSNALAFTPGVGNIIDGSIASGPVLTPLPAPEPASLGLMAMGGLLMLRKRR